MLVKITQKHNHNNVNTFANYVETQTKARLNYHDPT